MNVYLIRHGEAESGGMGMSDFDRQLTPHGRKVMKKAAEAWMRIIPTPEMIISSPLIRAKQTAEIVHAVMKVNSDIIFDRRLAGNDDTDSICEMVNTLGPKSVMLFGHEPDMSIHLSNLVSNGSMMAEYKKGMIAKISFYTRAKPGKGVLEFLLPAKLFDI